MSGIPLDPSDRFRVLSMGLDGEISNFLTEAAGGESLTISTASTASTRTTLPTMSTMSSMSTMYQRTTSTTSDADGDVAGNDYHDADQVTNDVQ